MAEQVSAHALARELLAGPDKPVMMVVGPTAAAWVQSAVRDEGAGVIELHRSPEAAEASAAEDPVCRAVLAGAW